MVNKIKLKINSFIKEWFGFLGGFIFGFSLPFEPILISPYFMIVGVIMIVMSFSYNYN